MAQKEYSVGYALFISCAAAMGGFLFGFDTSVINGTLGALELKLQTTAAELGVAASVAVLGAAVGAFSAGTLANKFGRKKVMFAAAIVFFLSSVGAGYPFFFTGLDNGHANLIEFILWRAFGGIGIGAASIIVPAYIAEVSPGALRGRLATMQQFAIVIGIFAAQLSNFVIGQIIAGGVVEIDPATRKAIAATTLGGFETWQIMFWIECIPAALYGALIVFLPESPRYLVARNETAKAADILGKIISPSAVAQKIEDIKATLQNEVVPKFSDLIEKIGGAKRITPILWVGIGLAMLQQFTGINVIFYYGEVLWRSVGFCQEDAMLTNIISASVNILSTIIAIALIDKVGRKPLLWIGSAGMAFTLGILAIIFATAGVDNYGNPILKGATSYFAVISANLFIVFFAFSWGPVMWVLLGEMFNNRIRAVALAVCGLLHWIANFFISSTFPIMLSTIGLGAAYGFYAISALAGMVFVLKFVKETKGKELEEM